MILHYQLKSQTLIKDIYSGLGNSDINFVLVTDNGVVFTAKSYNEGYEYYFTDGTSTGTHSLGDLNPGQNTLQFNPTAIAFGSKFFFIAATTPSTYALFISDGTKENTEKLTTIGFQSSNLLDSRGMLIYKNKLYFMNSTNNGNELWVSDGTPSGTHELADIYKGSGSSNPFGFCEYNNDLYFYANDYIHGIELWKTDGTTEGTKLYLDLTPGDKSSINYYYNGYLASLNKKLIFSAKNPQTNMPELFATNGDSSSIQLLRHPNETATFKDFPTFILSKDTNLYFTQFTSQYGKELFKTNGTALGTQLLKDISPNANSSNFISFNILNNDIIFIVDDNSMNYGQEIWKTDGTVTNTNIVRNVGLGSTGSAWGNLEKIGNKLYYIGITPALGPELWETDGTEKGTLLTVETNPFNFNTETLRLKAFKNMILITFTSNKNNAGQELYVFNPSTGIQPITYNTTTLFPNPCKLGQTLSIQSESTITNLTLIDQLGRTESISLLKDQQFDLPSSVSAGIYLIQYTTEKGTLLEKISVVN